MSVPCLERAEYAARMTAVKERVSAGGRPLLRRDDVRRLLLHATQLGRWNMTADLMARLGGPPRWCFLVTDVADTPWAAALERTTPGWRKQVHHVLGRERRPGVGVRFQNGAEQHLGVGVRGQAINGP